MSATELLGELASRGVSIAVRGDSLILKPRRALDDFLLARVREAKPEIIRALSARPATCAPSCYEVEPGRWLHHRWDGCTTPLTAMPELPRVAHAALCWHCSGTRFCGCSSCAAGLAPGATGKCVACRGTGKVWMQ